MHMTIDVSCWDTQGWCNTEFCADEQSSDIQNTAPQKKFSGCRTRRDGGKKNNTVVEKLDSK